MTEKELAEKLRKKYIESPPEGLSKQDIRLMSDGDLLDMDYFLNDEDLDDFSPVQTTTRSSRGTRRSRSNYFDSDLPSIFNR